MDTLPPEKIEELRTAVRARISATSLRSTAREVRMSPAGLGKFADGTMPYAPTVAKLLAWHGDDDAQREQEGKVAAFLGLVAAQRKAVAEPILRLLLTGPSASATGDSPDLREAAADILLLSLAPHQRRLARALLSLTIQRGNAAPPRYARDLTAADVDLLAHLVDLVGTHLPLDTTITLGGTPVAGTTVVRSLRSWVRRLKP